MTWNDISMDDYRLSIHTYKVCYTGYFKKQNTWSGNGNRYETQSLTRGSNICTRVKFPEIALINFHIVATTFRKTFFVHP